MYNSWTISKKLTVSNVILAASFAAKFSESAAQGTQKALGFVIN
jgi:hypothetical protein